MENKDHLTAELISVRNDDTNPAKGGFFFGNFWVKITFAIVYLIDTTTQEVVGTIRPVRHRWGESSKDVDAQFMLIANENDNAWTIQVEDFESYSTEDNHRKSDYFISITLKSNDSNSSTYLFNASICDEPTYDDDEDDLRLTDYWTHYSIHNPDIE
jgi:hypothetical protein